MVAMSVSVTVEHVVKRFDGAFVALKGVSVAIQPGELFFLLGPSGCGKTTLLRCIAGFHTPEEGCIRIGERDVTQVPPHLRDTGMMFQSYALWPHLTLAENVAFGLEMRKVPKTEIARRVHEALDRVHLAVRAKQKPNQLSGGQQQRVALARALVIEPQCLLLDEPLSNLDAKLRIEMRTEIRKICKQVGLTAIYVTHDQKEALSIADRLAVMRDGVIEQIGSPEEVYRAPNNRFVAGFIGEGNFFSGRVTHIAKAEIVVETDIGVFTSTRIPVGVNVGEAVDVCVRPEAISLGHSLDPLPNRVQGQFIETTYLGEVAQHQIAVMADKGAACHVKVSELNPYEGRDRSCERSELCIARDHVIVMRK